MYCKKPPPRTGGTKESNIAIKIHRRMARKPELIGGTFLGDEADCENSSPQKRVSTEGEKRAEVLNTTWGFKIQGIRGIAGCFLW